MRSNNLKKELDIDNRLTRTIVPQPGLVRPASTLEVDIIQHNSIEYIAKLATLFNGFFDEFYTHQSHNYLRSRVMLVCSNVANLTVRVDASVSLKPISTFYKGKFSFMSLFNKRFFDTTNQTLCNESESCGYNIQPGTRIVIPVKTSDFNQDITVGYFFRDQQSLVVTDWSHTEESIEFVESVRDILIQELGLKFVLRRKHLLRPIPIKIGCDPEFEVLDEQQGRIIDAHNLNIDREGNIGRDGRGTQIEFRPPPGTPDDVVSTLSSYFVRFREQHKKTLVISGHIEPLGGHIHIGVGRRIPSVPQPLLDLLDDFIGRPTIELSGNARSSYKEQSKWESKNWGFEYRTPPAAIFYNPTITRISFKLALNLTHMFINTKKPLIYKVPISINDLVNIGCLTANEARYYLKKLGQIKQLIDTHRPIPAAWEGNKSKYSSLDKLEISKAQITCTEEWNPIIQRSIKEALQISLKPILKEVKVIRLFGFRQERGLVSNIVIPGTDITKIDDVPPISGTSAMLNIGLPFPFRNNLLTFNILKDKVVMAIVSQVVRTLPGNIIQEEREHIVIEQRQDSGDLTCIISNVTERGLGQRRRRRS
jgi:hypothetical protein